MVSIDRESKVIHLCLIHFKTVFFKISHFFKVAPFQMAGRWPITKTGDMGAQLVSQHNLPSDCCVVALLGYQMGTSLQLLFSHQQNDARLWHGRLDP
jgi:hypothetical protein